MSTSRFLSSLLAEPVARAGPPAGPRGHGPHSVGADARAGAGGAGGAGGQVGEHERQGARDRAQVGGRAHRQGARQGRRQVAAMVRRYLLQWPPEEPPEEQLVAVVKPGGQSGRSERRGSKALRLLGQRPGEESWEAKEAL
eukprot:8994803-Pyramimonas_sp.AAC.1